MLHQASGRWKLGLLLALVTAACWATLPVALKMIIALTSIKNMVVIVWQKASYRYVPRCALPRLCWLVMQMWCQIFIASVLFIEVQV